MGGGPTAGPEDLSALDSTVRRLRADARVITAELIPVPLADLRGKEAFFARNEQRETSAGNRTQHGRSQRHRELRPSAGAPLFEGPPRVRADGHRPVPVPCLPGGR